MREPRGTSGGGGRTVQVRRRRAIDRRLFTLLVAMFVGLLTVGVRLTFIQVVMAGKYTRMARAQRLEKIGLAARRGTIADRSGRELAFSLDAATIYATPYQVKDATGTALKLARVLNVRKRSLYFRLVRDGGFVYLARKADLATGARVKKMRLAGIGVLSEPKRSYPGGDLAAHVLGFVGTDNNGLAGLELYYEKYLRGRPGRMVAEFDSQGRSIPGGAIQISAPVDGNNVTLTLDRDIQYKAQSELTRGVQESGAKSGSIIVMDAQNGQIYAMANEPTFDVNHFGQAEQSALRNRCVTDVFEPGSTAKLITAAGVMEEGLYGPRSTFVLPSAIQVGDRVIKESHDRDTQNFTLTRIISESSNVGAVVLGMKLGRERLYKYLKAFGMTEPTGIDFPGEGRPVVPLPESWSASSIGNIPFGQGIAVSSLQVAQATQTIANGGVRARPHLLMGIRDTRGRVVRSPQRDRGSRVVSRDTAAKLIHMMEQAVRSGTGTMAAVPGYTVAGKTGTAQKVGSEGGYAAGRYVASFTGFVPARNPRLVVTVIIDEPQGAIYGGTVAAPVFRKVAQFALFRLKIPPSGR